MSIVTQEHLFQWNIEQILKKIKEDYSAQIESDIQTRKDISSFEDWLHAYPHIFGMFALEQLSVNFDFDEFENSKI